MDLPIREEWEGETRELILVVDDLAYMRSFMKSALQHFGFHVLEAGDSQTAMNIMENDGTRPALVLLDIRLGSDNGLDLLKVIKQRYPSVAVVMVSALDDVDDAVAAMKAGAYDYLVKPVTISRLVASVKGALARRQLVLGQERYYKRLEKEVRERTRDIREMRDAAVFALAKLAESRDDETGLHLDRMREYTLVISKQMKKHGVEGIDNNFIENIYLASALHDIGKVGIRDAVLLKPGKLTPEEFEEMKQHTIIGAKCLEEAEKRVKHATATFLTVGKEVARHHHERFDGKGYPDGLKGKEIPLAARIVTAADFYDALAFPRIYRKWSYPHDQIIKMIEKEAGSMFDPDVVKAVVEVEKELKNIAAKFKE